MSAMHKDMDKKREICVERFVEALVVAFANQMQMSLPSAAYAIHQVTTAQMALWDKDATVKNLRAIAQHINGDITHADLQEILRRQFDLICAGYERQSGADQH